MFTDKPTTPEELERYFAHLTKVSDSYLNVMQQLVNKNPDAMVDWMGIMIVRLAVAFAGNDTNTAVRAHYARTLTKEVGKVVNNILKIHDTKHEMRNTEH